MEKTHFSTLQDEFFVRTVKEMPFPIVKQISEKNLTHIPIDLVGNPEALALYLSSKFDAKAKELILAEYGDAGHALIYYFKWNRDAVS